MKIGKFKTLKLNMRGGFGRKENPTCGLKGRQESWGRRYAQLSHMFLVYLFTWRFVYHCQRRGAWSSVQHEMREYLSGFYACFHSQYLPISKSNLWILNSLADDPFFGVIWLSIRAVALFSCTSNATCWSFGLFLLAILILLLLDETFAHYSQPGRYSMFISLVQQSPERDWRAQHRHWGLEGRAAKAACSH